MKIHIGNYPKDPEKERKVSIRIDKWDVWNMDDTLAMIIAPMLKLLKEDKQGIPGSFLHGENNDENWKVAEEKWDEVLDKMIWSFEQYQIDWEDQYWLVHPEFDFEKYPEDEDKTLIPVRWKVEGKCDWEGRQKHWDRIQEGLELFGKHFSELWS